MLSLYTQIQISRIGKSLAQGVTQYSSALSMNYQIYMAREKGKPKNIQGALQALGVGTALQATSWLICTREAY